MVCDAYSVRTSTTEIRECRPRRATQSLPQWKCCTIQERQVRWAAPQQLTPWVDGSSGPGLKREDGRRLRRLQEVKRAV